MTLDRCRDCIPFLMLFVVGVLGGAMIPLTTIIMAWLGLCEPFQLTLFGKMFEFRSVLKRRK